MGKHVTDRAAEKINQAHSEVSGEGRDVLGPSTNPATNLIIQDILLRSSGRIARLAVEKGLLRRRYGSSHAKNIVENRSLLHTLAAYGVTKVATRSVPGALLVGGGLAIKTLFDRSQSKKKAGRQGDRMLDKQAEE